MDKKQPLNGEVWELDGDKYFIVWIGFLESFKGELQKTICCMTPDRGFSDIHFLYDYFADNGKFIGKSKFKFTDLVEIADD